MPNSESNKERIRKIKMEMGAHDMTKCALAEALHINRTTLALKLNAEKAWTVAELEALAVIFNKDNNYFF